MSTAAVRGVFRAAWPSMMPGVVFFETVNVSVTDESVEALPALWGTLSFTADSQSHVTMGSRPWIEETGTVSVVLAAKAGEGDALVSDAAQDASIAWMSWIDSTGNTWVREVLGPRPLAENTLGPWMTLTVDLQYTHQRRS